LEKLDTETHLEKWDPLVKYFLSRPGENLVGDISGHDFRTATINEEDTYLGVDNYVLVQTLLMPGLYHWGPIDKIRNLRRQSDTSKQIFSRIGSIMLDRDLRSENRLMLQDFVNNIKKSGGSPEKMEKILEDFISKIEQAKKKASFFMSIRASKDPLSTYKNKRKFDKTDEPEGKIESKNKHRFVIQRHFAEKAGQHFDLRLENDNGTMTSWALPKHKLPSGKERLLAVKTEDHPVSYNKFHGVIPEGKYGAGKVEIYDSGTYEELYRSGNKIVFKFKGKKESGTFKIFKTDGNKWLIMQGKKEDAEKDK